MLSRVNSWALTFEYLTQSIGLARESVYIRETGGVHRVCHPGPRRLADVEVRAFTKR